jgi:hypothetical protein
MFSTCLHCTKDLGTNEVVETLPIGRRLAFDAAQGRLWVVCRHCAKWNLVPFDTRLESIDACERLYRDTKTRYATDNIGLARVKEGLELVRIGQPLRPEFVSWRYGEQYKRRRRKNQLMAGAAAGVVVAGFLGLGAAGVSLGAFMYGAQQLTKGAYEGMLKRRRRISLAHPETAAAVRLEPWSSHHATLAWDRPDGPSLLVPSNGADSHSIEVLRWQDVQARSVGRRVLGSANLMLGSRIELELAADLLADHGGDLGGWARRRSASLTRYLGPRKWDETLTKGWAHRPPIWDSLECDYLILGQLVPHERLAVEMWLSEDAERIWLEGELKLLEREWRDAERIAKISDSLALPPEVTEDLHHRKVDQ